MAPEPSESGVSQVQLRFPVDIQKAELILTARPSTGLTVTLGTNVLQTGLRQKIDLTAASLGTARFDDRQRSIGLFGELRADFAARWEITAGGRYQRDSQRRTGTLQIGPLGCR